VIHDRESLIEGDTMTALWHDDRGHVIPPPPPLPPAVYAATPTYLHQLALSTLPAATPRRTIPVPLRYAAGILALAVTGLVGVGIGHGHTTAGTHGHSTAYTKGYNAGLNAIRDMLIEGSDPAVVADVVDTSSYSTCQSALNATVYADNDDALQGCADGMHQALAGSDT
jgi:hypothetical protein